MYNKKHTKETKEILKKHRSENISNSKIKDSCQKFNKPVLMYDLYMNFIKKFDSVKETSKETGINESIISKCCRGDIKNPTRYYFKYENDKDKVKNNKFLIDKNTEFKYNKKRYILKKRNKKTAICYCLDTKTNVTIHERDLITLI